MEREQIEKLAEEYTKSKGFQFHAKENFIAGAIEATNATVDEAKQRLRDSIKFPMMSHLESVTFSYHEVMKILSSLKL